jgi:hypothetical protein
VVAAPVFKNLAQYILYKNKNINKLAEKDAKDINLMKIKNNIDVVQVKDSSAKAINPNLIPSMIGLDKISSINLANKLNLKILPTGSGVVSSQSPAPGTPISENQTLKLEYSPPRYE